MKRAAVIACFGLLACNDPLAPFEPEIRNLPGSFEFQATGIRNVTWVQMYTWQNAGTAANVDHASTVTAGTATLTILDADGVQVYTHPLDASGSVTTAAGASGAWTIHVALIDLDGTLNFRVQTP